VRLADFGLSKIMEDGTR